ncbi:amino acid ABC transporter permease [Sediminispirochaeta smaragdinae]|uniref:Polar amino acid ABC transporter, inner membrane subunit n=1 Tax=Sediminispirochaeta smaragdinae (strain DSM 11293 / JCM 15392 / SEBR 4228) TaxID=573413 RepID=E1RC51_SEDSS|nr:amino acid ABC transporter permease [Sediminispirochaeta smaragdinae]ADK79931.1 polar amino acid ABC transporter, inner membrane subunit [Sediminispirochaeta smaragdinae DSM 11293]
MDSMLIRFVTRNFRFYLEGLETALSASIISLLFALIIGLVVGIIRYSHKGILGTIAKIYVSAIRNTPLLVQLYFVFFGLPRLGIVLSAFQTGVIGLSFNSGAYIAEMVKAGFQAIPRGQIEAAESIGLSVHQRFRLILIPQAALQIVPAVGGQMVQLIKDTCLLSLLAITEITKAATEVGNKTYMFLQAFLFAGIIYLIVNMLLNIAIDLFERKINYAR